MKNLTVMVNDNLFTLSVDEETYEELKNDREKLERYAAYTYNAGMAEEEAQGTEEVQGAAYPRSAEESCHALEETFSWTQSSIEVLTSIRLGEENKFQRPACQKKKLWRQIATEMKSAGYNVTGDMCNTKYRNLLQTYRVNKKKESQTGEGAISWPYFEQFDCTLGHKASSAPHSHMLGASLQLSSPTTHPDATASTSRASTSRNTDDQFNLSLPVATEFEEEDERLNRSLPQGQSGRGKKSLSKGEYYLRKLEYSKEKEERRALERKESRAQKASSIKLFAEAIITSSKLMAEAILKN